MARPGRPERNRTARPFRQLRRFHHVINSDKVFGTHRTFAYPNDRGRLRKDGSASAPFFHATLADAGIDKHLADRARKLAKMPEAIFAAASRRSFSFDRRDQF